MVLLIHMIFECLEINLIKVIYIGAWLLVRWVELQIFHTIRKFSIFSLTLTNTYQRVIPGMLAASSIDKTVTIYDVQSYKTKQTPKSFQKDMNVGKLFTLNFYPSLPWLIGCGGSKNDIALWNLDSDPVIMKHFQDRISGVNATPVEKNEDATLFYPKKVEGDSKAKRNKKKGKSKRKAHKVQA